MIIARDRPNGDYLEITVEERDGSGTLSAGFSPPSFIASVAAGDFSPNLLKSFGSNAATRVARSRPS